MHLAVFYFSSLFTKIITSYYCQITQSIRVFSLLYKCIDVYIYEKNYIVYIIKY
jgi:hypothetical protein